MGRLNDAVKWLSRRFGGGAMATETEERLPLQEQPTKVDTPVPEPTPTPTPPDQTTRDSWVQTQTAAIREQLQRDGAPAAVKVPIPTLMVVVGSDQRYFQTGREHDPLIAKAFAKRSLLLRHIIDDSIRRGLGDGAAIIDVATTMRNLRTQQLSGLSETDFAQDVQKACVSVARAELQTGRNVALSTVDMLPEQLRQISEWPKESSSLQVLGVLEQDRHRAARILGLTFTTELRRYKSELTKEDSDGVDSELTAQAEALAGLCDPIAEKAVPITLVDPYGNLLLSPERAQGHTTPQVNSFDANELRKIQRGPLHPAIDRFILVGGLTNIFLLRNEERSEMVNLTLEGLKKARSEETPALTVLLAVTPSWGENRMNFNEVIRSDIETEGPDGLANLANVSNSVGAANTLLVGAEKPGGFPQSFARRSVVYFDSAADHKEAATLITTAKEHHLGNSVVALVPTPEQTTLLCALIDDSRNPARLPHIVSSLHEEFTGHVQAGVEAAIKAGVERLVCLDPVSGRILADSNDNPALLTDAGLRSNILRDLSERPLTQADLSTTAQVIGNSTVFGRSRHWEDPKDWPQKITQAFSALATAVEQAGQGPVVVTEQQISASLAQMEGVLKEKSARAVISLFDPNDGRPGLQCAAGAKCTASSDHHVAFTFGRVASPEPGSQAIPKVLIVAKQDLVALAVRVPRLGDKLQLPPEQTQVQAKEPTR